MYVVPSVRGVVASDMSRTIAPWCRAPGAENTERAQGLQQRRSIPRIRLCAHIYSCLGHLLQHQW